MAKFDYQRRSEVDRLRRQGIDRVNDFDVPVGFRGPPRKRQSKADVRAELEALLANHTAKTKPAAPARATGLKKPTTSK